MDLPDCPPGAEGYQDSVVEMAKKPTGEPSCTKAEQEFQEHLNSLKIKLDNGETRCMVERRGRDISGKWIYLCYPCGSVCSGESILQMHISGKKHKAKLSMKTTWPVSIFDDHPFNQNQKATARSTATETVLQKMAVAVENYTKPPDELDQKFSKFCEGTCHIQETLDTTKAPLVGVEYLVEHPPDMPHYEPSYLCTLCSKQGHPRTIVNHLTCYWHRYNYLARHFPKACQLLSACKNVTKYREGVNLILNRLTQRIEFKYGRLRPINIEKEEFERDKEQIMQRIYKGHHISEKMGSTFEEVVDMDLINTLAKSAEAREETINQKNAPLVKKRDPSPPIVAAPSKPHNARYGRRERRHSVESLSDISDDDTKRPGSRAFRPLTAAERAYKRDRQEPKHERHPEQYAEQRREIEIFRSKYTREVREKEEKPVPKTREPYKMMLAEEKRQAATEAAAQMLAYHEKNPEKHPLYPDEWKKFWNRRYKEIQTEGKDPSKHDFKPEWIVFWTKRMKELHEEELATEISEIYRRMNLPVPERAPLLQARSSAERAERRREPVWAARAPDHRRRSPEPRRRSPEPRRRSPEPRRRSPEPRRRSPEPRRRSPDDRRTSPRHDYRPEKRIAPDPRYSIDRRAPPAAKRTRSRSPAPRRRSPARMHLTLESGRRSRSPLSRRDSELRNRSPQPHRASPPRDLAPSLQTVMISDDELKPEDGLSPWNSDNDIESISSVSRSVRAPSHASSRTRYAPRQEAQDLGPPENIVATLRVLVALEDYLGSLGPKIVDLLTDALKMEKERANSSEELLEREAAVVLIETAKEKLKGAAQAGLVPAAAAPALRAAIVRAAATLHEADTRTRRTQAAKKKTVAVSKPEAVPVAGVGEVDRAQIAQQMAAALVAQGKTDVTADELAQLVDAVVGMAEAKKREAGARPEPPPARAPPPALGGTASALSGTATALQMLQSAYDENDKKVEKEDVPDAMDGLSDSDLETLLKNFNELSAEEQHSLIAYLKKLEAREPQRVERLRQYVSAAAAAPPPPARAEPPPAPPTTTKDLKPVAIESDDDDYTVEEVFQSATKKVKEDQIRKELDIVKKSLKESKEDASEPPPPVKANPIVELTKQMSAASDLFALVQASIKSTSTAPAAAAQNVDVVASSTQPRSFGDVPETPVESHSKPQISPTIPVTPALITTVNVQESTRPLQNQSNNFDDENDSYDQALQWDKNQMDTTPDNRGPPMRDQGFHDFSQGQVRQEPVQNQFGSGPNQLVQGSGRQFGSNSGPSQFSQGNNSGMDQGSNSGMDQSRNSGMDQGRNSGMDQGRNSGIYDLDQGHNSGYGQGNNSGMDQGHNSGYGQGNNSGMDQGRNSGMDQGHNSGYGQGNNSGMDQGRNSGMDQSHNSGFGQGPNTGFSQRPNLAPNQFNQGPGSYQPGQGPNQFGQGHNSGSDWQGRHGHQPWQGTNHFQQNQGLNNFMNGGRMDSRPQQFDHMNQQQFGKNNFRGRGGGGRPRGWGRGRF